MSAIYYPALAQHAGTMIMPDTRGPMLPNFGVVLARQRLSTDSIGTCSVRVQNAVTGSRYRIEVSSTGTLVAEGDVSSADFSVSVPLYPAGNAANTLKVKIRKGTTAPKYQPFETQVTAVSAGALAYVSQVLDTIA